MQTGVFQRKPVDCLLERLMSVIDAATVSVVIFVGHLFTSSSLFTSEYFDNKTDQLTYYLLSSFTVCV